ncbi:hypothetical protein AB6A40_000249 [Gnathostoma spinigerum]|uniref:Uncharacterized protein n=1 Tax=Gnathostoma spinigerum TaxID=75299 RepID=A0ABD6E2M6_9BILA
MQKALVLCIILIVIHSVQAKPKPGGDIEKLIKGIGKAVKHAILTTTTTTSPPDVIDAVLDQGRDIVGGKLLEKVGELAEKQGINRGMAEEFGRQALDKGFKKGKKLLQRLRSGSKSPERQLSTDSEATMVKHDALGAQVSSDDVEEPFQKIESVRVAAM